MRPSIRHQIFLNFMLLVFIGTPAVAYGQSAVKHFLKAEALRRNEQLDAALKQYDSAIFINPNNHQFHFEKSKCLVFLNREADAIKALERVVAMRPDHIESYSRLAWLYERQRNYPALIESLEQAATHHHDERYKSEYRLRILRTLALTESFQKAGPHLEKAEEMIDESSGSFGDLLYYQAKYFNTQEKYQKAIDKAKEGLYFTTSVETKHVAKFYYELGYAYYQQGQYRNARAAFTYAKYDEFEPLIARLSPDYNFALAKAYFTAHLYDKAVTAIDKCLSFDKDYPGAMRLRNRLSQRMGNLGSIKVGRTRLSVELDPQRKAQKYAELSMLLLGADKYSQAVDAANECLAIKANQWQIVMVKARSLWLMGQRRQAKDLLKTVIDALSTSGNLGGQASFMLGKILLEENNPADARKAFEAAQHGIFYQAAEYELFGLDS